MSIENKGEEAFMKGHQHLTNRILSSLKKYVAEFFGTLILVYSLTLTATGKEEAKHMTMALIHGLALFVAIMTFGRVSGGHYNPAVSLGVLISGNLHIIDFPFYILFQILGSFVGALLTKACAGTLGGINMPADGMDWWQALLTEFICTAIFVLAILMICNKVENHAGISAAIGAALAAVAFVSIPISTTGVNPARSLGPSIVGSIWPPNRLPIEDIWNAHYIYWAGPLLGAAFAALLHKFMLKEKREYV